MSTTRRVGRLLSPLMLLLLAAQAATAVGVAATAHVELDVALEPGSRRLGVLAVVTPDQANFRFALHESLQITAASANGRPVKITAAGREGDLRGWRAVLPAGSTALRIEYQGTLPELDPRLDHRKVLRRLPPMAAVEGSFLPSGGAWYPQPAKLFSYRVKLTVPGDQRALVAGRLLEEDVPTAPGGRYRASFEFTNPADGIDLMAGPWIVRERMMARSGAEPLRLRTYFTPELEQVAGLADSYLEDTAGYLAHYSKEIGAYPFSGFSVVASPLPTGFGMPTLTYLGAEVLKLPFIRATSLGHEIVHNWWGNGVYVDYASGNWAEGLTTFMADYAYKERESADAARALRLGWLRDFAALPADSRQTLISFRSRTHGAAAAVGYGKAAMVFLMLRDQLGEADFQRGLRVFWQQQRFRVASWSDLQRAFEQASGKSLAVFFSQWLTRDGAPDLRISKASATAVGAGYRLEIEVTQRAPAYSLRLPIAVNTAGRSEAHVVQVDRLRQSVSLAAERLAGRRSPAAVGSPRPGPATLAITRPQATATDPAPVDRRSRTALAAGVDAPGGARSSGRTGRPRPRGGTTGNRPGRLARRDHTGIADRRPCRCRCRAGGGEAAAAAAGPRQSGYGTTMDACRQDRRATGGDFRARRQRPARAAAAAAALRQSELAGLRWQPRA